MVSEVENFYIAFPNRFAQKLFFTGTAPACVALALYKRKITCFNRPM
jgi:hypothetical protein